VKEVCITYNKSMYWKKGWLPVFFGLLLLTSFWFVGVQENKNATIARNIADYTLNSKPKISFNFPEGVAPETFIEPASSAGEPKSYLATELPSVKQKINPADFGPGMSLDLNNFPKQTFADNTQSANEQLISDKKPIYLPEIFGNAPKLQANQLISVKLLAPRSMAGVNELLKLLEEFGDLINVPKDELTWEFTSRDKAILQKTKELYGNPTHFQLGEQCGGEGAADTYPPGSTTSTACGGEREYSVDGGGGSCNTDRQCFGTGFCFRTCYSYYAGSYCYCWVPSCLGVCGFESYIWDDVTKTCGCGATGGGVSSQSNRGSGGGSSVGSGGSGGAGGNTPPVTLSNGLTVNDAGTAINSISGVGFAGQYDPNGATVMFDNSMTQAERNAWIANNPNALAGAPPGTIIYVTNGSNWDTVTNAVGAQGADAFNCLTSCINDNGVQTSGAFIDSSLAGTAAGDGYPSSFTNISYSDMVLTHEIGHQVINQAGLQNDPFLQGQFAQYNNSLPFGGEQFIEYGPTNQIPNVNEYSAEVYALYKGSNGTYQPSVPASAQIYNDTVNYMKSKGILP